MNFHHTILPLALCAILPAQTLEPGYGDSTRSLPDASSQALYLQDLDAAVYFDGSDLWLDQGETDRSLLSFASPVFGAFTIRVGAGHLLFAESSNGELWLVPLRETLSPRLLATTSFPYDAALFDPGTVIISAKTGGFAAADNELLALDLRAGTLTSLALLPGASGPVACDARGLYYATASDAWPAPPGSTELLLFPRRLIERALGNQVLGLDDATSLATGFDSAAALAIDADGDLFLIDFYGPTIVEWSPQRRSVLATYDWTGATPSTLQFVDGGRGRGAFEPFQPAGPQQLVVHESLYGSTSRLRFIEPARPTAELTGSDDTLALELSGLPAEGTALTVFSVAATHWERKLPIRGFEQPLFLLPSMLCSPYSSRNTINGDGTLMLPMPGFRAPRYWRIATQSLFVDAAGEVIGSSEPLILR